MTHQKQKTVTYLGTPQENDLCLGTASQDSERLYGWALGISISCGSFDSTVQKDLKITEQKPFIALK